MKKIVVSSIRNNAGKTSLIAGIISSVTNKKFAYSKPLGDRLIYKRKKSWDYDAIFMVNLLGRTGELESLYDKVTLGFDHSKLQYMYDEAGIKAALNQIVTEIGAENDVLFLEGGRNMVNGTYIHLDPISVSRFVGGKLVVVVSGNNDTILDDIKFMVKYWNVNDTNFGGVIINKVKDIDEFGEVHLPMIKELKIDVMGVIPYKEQLTHFTIDFLAEKLFAKVLAGEENLKNTVKNIIIGAMSTFDPQRNPLFTKPSLNKENQLMITGGDRSDMILAALDRDTAGIILTNDIMPPENIIAKAREKKMPLLLVTLDTYQAAKQIDALEPLLTIDHEEKKKLLSLLVEKYVDVEKLLS